jgi:hypothetical protein
MKLTYFLEENLDYEFYETITSVESKILAKEIPD